MKRQFISIMMIGALASGMTMGGFANTSTTNAPAPINSPTCVTSTTTSPGGIQFPSDDVSASLLYQQSQGLRHQIAVLKQQLERIDEKIEQAEDTVKHDNGNNRKEDKKNEKKNNKNHKYTSTDQTEQQNLLNQLTKEFANKQNLLNGYNKQLQIIMDKMENINDGKYTDKEKDYLKKIEDAISRNNSKLVAIPADHVLSDIPNFKLDMPMAQKNGVVYMPKSVLPNQFATAVKYDDQGKKFIFKIDGTLVEMFLLQNVIEIDGIAKKAIAKPIVMDDKVYLPMNDLQKLLNVQLKWDATTKVLVIDDLDIANPAVPVPVVPVVPVAPVTN